MRAPTNYESWEILSFSNRRIPCVVTTYYQHKTREDEDIVGGQYPLPTYTAKSCKI